MYNRNILVQIQRPGLIRCSVQLSSLDKGAERISGSVVERLLDKSGTATRIRTAPITS
jgi:hypothetical protein